MSEQCSGSSKWQSLMLIIANIAPLSPSQTFSAHTLFQVNLRSTHFFVAKKVMLWIKLIECSQENRKKKDENIYLGGLVLKVLCMQTEESIY